MYNGIFKVKVENSRSQKFFWSNNKYNKFKKEYFVSIMSFIL